MQPVRSLLTICFCAGLLGALCSSLVAWQCGHWGITRFAGVSYAPALTSSWLYAQMIWGGLWGLAYFLTVGPYNSRRHWARKGLWVSLLPSLFHLFIVFPYFTNHQIAGIGLGHLTAIFILSYNLIWGFATGIFARLLHGRHR